MRKKSARTFLGIGSAILATAVAHSGRAASVGDVFVIALENENLTEPAADGPQLLGNPAASFLNSLMTPGNPNASNVSYATNYTNAGNGVHPSEPNYIWSEAGTNFNPETNTTVLTDADPSASAGNIFSTTPHLTGLLNAAGIPWKNYQEDVQISNEGATVSASGILPSGATNPYNGSDLFNYSAKHNPMAFFTDSDTNVSPISQLQTDLSNNTVGRYNWITPDQYNDMHTAVNGGFTYHGTRYLNSQAQVAQGDNFLSIVVPEIEASAAFKNNGMIIIWNDESEGGDTSQFDMPEIVISPLAKGNAYASSVPLNHSSDLKTMEEIFGLGPTYLNNAIPSSEYSATNINAVNSVALSNDFSDLLQPGVLTPFPVLWAGGAGNWSNQASWNNGPVPISTNGEVQIANGNPIASVVTLDVSASIGDLILDADDALNINAGQSLTLTGTTPTRFNGSVATNGDLIGVNASVGTAGKFTLAANGSLAITSTFTNQGTTILNGLQNWSAGAIFNNSGGSATFNTDAGSSGSNLTVNVFAGTVTFASTQHLLGLNISNGASAALTGGGNGNRSILITPSLVVAGSLDLTSNDLDVQKGSLAAVSALVAQAYHDGTWTDTGITSSSAANDTTHLTAIGVIQNNQSGAALFTASDLFDGTIPGTSDVLAAYTWYGDANLDGKVDGSDYSLIDNGCLHGLTGWYNGDFNYDRVVDGSDYTLIDNAFNSQGAALTAITATQTSEPSSVPEPTAAGLCIGAVLMLGRDRRARRLPAGV